MEIWCKWSAWQESLFIAYSHTVERPHGTRIMKYFCFSLLQEAFCFRTCSTWSPSSLKHCRCGRLWKGRAKSLASAQFVSGPAAQTIRRNKIFSCFVELRDKNQKPNQPTNQKGPKRHIFYKYVSIHLPISCEFFILFPLEASGTAKILEWKNGFGLKYASKNNKLQNVLVTHAY